MKDAVSRVLGSRGWLAGVVLLAVAVRAAHLHALRDAPWLAHLFVDPEYYDAWARRIAAGDWLGDAPFYMDPLYPYVLAVLYRLWGRDLMMARLLNVACSAGACVAVAALGRRVAGPAAGGLAALGLALYAPDVFYVGEVDKTSLSVLLSAGFLALACGRTLAARLGAGFVLGLAALTRANFLVFLFCFAPVRAAPAAPCSVGRRAAKRGLRPSPFCFAPVRAAPAAPCSDGRRAAKRGSRRSRTGPVPRRLVTRCRGGWRAWWAGALAFVAGVALALGPVAWRNHRVSGEWVLTTAQAGQNFYTGNNPTNPWGAYGAVPFVRANPHFEQEDFRAEAEARAGRPLGAREVSRFWFAEAVDHIRARPAFAARVFARKLALFWNDFEISDSQDQYLVARDSWVLRLPLPGFGVVATLALLGAVAGFRARRGVRLLVGFVAVYCATLVAFFLFSRYRIQVVPALLPLAAFGLLELGARLRARDPRRIAGAALVLALGAAATFPTIGLFARDHPRVVEMRLRHLAVMYRTAGEPGLALAALREAVPHCPHGCPFALADLAALYRETGRYAEGEAYLRDFIRRHPEQRDAPGHLAELRAAARAHDGG